MTVYCSPEHIPFYDTLHQINIFLGGSIGLDNSAEKWQDEYIRHLVETYGDNQINIFNPRRDDWDGTWDMDPKEGTQFHEQVKWELNAQENSDILIYYFAANQLSPITLLELGIYSRSDQTQLVYVDPDYPRAGNVIITCNYLGIRWTNDKKAHMELVKDCSSKLCKMYTGQDLSPIIKD